MIITGFPCGIQALKTSQVFPNIPNLKENYDEKVNESILFH